MEKNLSLAIQSLIIQSIATHFTDQSAAEQNSNGTV
jgi:hypothetical protein